MAVRLTKDRPKSAASLKRIIKRARSARPPPLPEASDGAGPTSSAGMVRFDVPKKLEFLFKLHRYKVVYGGRGGAKSHSFAKALLALGATRPMRILCAREVQNSIKDSVHALLKDQIKLLKLEDFYDVLDNEIRGANGTVFIFSGLANHTIESIKSYEGIDIVWVEEAHVVSRRSWDILIPTIRKEVKNDAGEITFTSEIWISLNPEMADDETYQRFIESPPDDAIVVKMNWRDNPWFPEVLKKERIEFKRKRSKEDYENIWEGKPRTTIVGAIYALEVAAAVEDRRFARVPYDPRFPVHTFWDLGWNDKMVVIFAQKIAPSVINVINYYEDNFRKYSEVVAFMDKLGYRWGTHYLPHDGGNANPQTGKSAEMTLRDLGLRQVKVIKKGDPDEEIRQVRMFFPRVFVDNSNREGRDGGYVGGARLIECLRKVKRNVPEKTGEPGPIEKSQYLHGADAFRLLSRMADKLYNAQELRAMSGPVMQGWEPSDPGMGVLG